MNDAEKILTKEEGKKIYFECYCSWFYIGRETNYMNILHKSAIDEDFISWNTEFVERELNKLDYESDFFLSRLNDLLGRELEYRLVKKIYDILKTKLCKPNNFTIATQLLKPQLYIDIYPDKPFRGIIAQAHYNNDTKVVNEAFEFLIELIKENQIEEYFDLFKTCLEFNLLYELGYDNVLMSMMKDISKVTFIQDLQYRNDEFITLCYLIGFIKEKDYVNAYRALKLFYDLWNETGELFTNKLSLINQITKMNYTVNDVLALESFEIKNPKEDDLTSFIKHEFGKI